MVPYAGPHLGWETPLVKYVLGAGVRWYWASRSVSVKTSCTSGS